MTTHAVTLNYYDQFLQTLGADEVPTKKISNMTSENRAIFAKVIRAQLRGLANLPYGLGLDKHVYQELMQAIDIEPLTLMDMRWNTTNSQAKQMRSEVINQLIELRMAERNQLVELLTKHSSNAPYSAVAAIVVATACLSPAHLWKTLGLDSRDELKEWLTHNFPSLTAANADNMRWKRFFYLQLCQSEGDYVCLSPTCDECSTYSECYVSGDE
ncbi:nitrogen fixation protein NifQ [Reinekea thalattae]|nr:nitrogen fixation protein NifQ [Reinekea thalattae]